MAWPYRSDVTEEEKRLNEALCNFCNQASDPFEPVAKWDEFCRNNFRELRAAYNAWYSAKIHKPKS